MIKWTLETRKLKDLKNHPKNARKLSSDDAYQLNESIGKFGLIDKPIINTDNTIIGGHQRIAIVKSKLKQIECWIPDRTLTDAEVDELNIRLNRNTGDWDYDILANQWDIPDLIQWGFDAKELLSDGTDKTNKGKKDKICPHCGESL